VPKVGYALGEEELREGMSPSDAEWEKQVLAHHYDERWSSPAPWLFVAQQLHEASRVLWVKWRTARDHYHARVNAGRARTITINNHLGRVALMLAGMALENVLKAKLVGQGKGQEVPTSGHDLIELAKLVPVSLTTKEQQLLPELSVSVTWLARYPVPTKQSKMETLAIGLGEWDCFDALYRRLEGWTYNRRRSKAARQER
jgi:hypothetical protein